MVKKKKRRKKNPPSDSPVVALGKELFDLFLNEDNPGDLIALFAFYLYTARWQDTDQIRATVGYCANGLNWAPNRVRRAKKKLIELELVRDLILHDVQTNRIIGNFVKVNMSRPYVFPYDGSTSSTDDRQVNACKISSEIVKKKKIQKKKKEIDQDFDQFWEAYPKRKGKTAAKVKFTTLSKNGVLPPIKKIIQAIRAQVNSKEWQKDDGEFIPYPTTWLNQGRWDDEMEINRTKTSRRRVNIGAQEKWD